MKKYEMNDEMYNIFMTMCDISLKHGGLSNLNIINRAVAFIENPIPNETPQKGK